LLKALQAGFKTRNRYVPRSTRKENMRSFALIALFAFSAQVYAEEPDMVTKLANKLVDKLVEASQNGSLDATTLGKPANLPSSLSQKGIHAQRMPPVNAMQAYNPIDAKKAETLSYLPQLSNQQIENQISYMIRNGWTPALEMSEDPDVYLNTRMGPGYYDNRYWSQYKLPMFGCTDPYQVVAEIENCKREFPSAKVRVIAYDSVKQVQAAAFMVRN
jgi:ribulose-bisphosphate carboxylase small chain